MENIPIQICSECGNPIHENENWIEENGKTFHQYPSNAGVCEGIRNIKMFLETAKDKEEIKNLMQVLYEYEYQLEKITITA